MPMTMEETMNLTDIPDLSGLTSESSTDAGFSDGWYAATILERREFTDKNGNDRVFETADTPSAAGDSRNITLQMSLKRQSDGREINLRTIVNYRPEYLSQESIQAVIADQAKTPEERDSSLLRASLTLQKLAKLQQIAGVRQFARNGNGGLDLHSTFGKSCYARIRPDSRNPQFKEVADFRMDKPKKAVVY